MKTLKRTENKALVWDIVFIGALAAFIVLSFFLFMRDNTRRILEQNDSFIQAATEQKAERLSELLSASQSSAEMMAQLYGYSMTKPAVDAEMLQDMTDRSSFDYVEFISLDGIDLTADGKTADLSDRPYFLDGIQGNSGLSVIYNSRITNETLLIFYAPFYHDGQINGVLSCILRGDTMLHILSSDYFGVEGSAYILARDGSVILAAGTDSTPENLLESLRSKNRIAPEDLERLEQTLDPENDIDYCTFNYKGSQGSGSAYALTLAGGEWVLMQTFPSSVAGNMTRQADSAGIRLEIQLAAAFLCYVIYLVTKGRIQKRRLVSEKQKASQIVSAVTGLFARFALVDYETDTYEYLQGKKSDAPEKGVYSQLVAHLAPKYVPDENSGEPMGRIIAQPYVQRHLTQDVPYLQYEYQIDLDGQRWENLSILCLRRRDGVPVQVLYAIQDVTVLKEQELEIRQAMKNASQAAEAANRAKSEFLARMSHDIRTPMNAIMGMTAVAAMHLDDQERLTDCLSKITISSRHLLALINDVLDMSKIESGKVTLSEEPFSMADMVKSVVTIIQPQANSKHQQLKVHISNVEHENVLGDILRLQQVFVNILGNAVKFTPEGGSITFSIQECAPMIHGMASYEFVCEDTGIGMDEGFLKTIFEPFSRSKSSLSQNIEGTGLGMSITRNIVQMMEGDIRVASQPGKGSRFTVQIHLKLQDGTAEDVEELADLRILVADDDSASCTAACEILTSIGMRSDGVSSGDEAIERVTAACGGSDEYAAVILDWKMPGRDGVETAREIRRLVGEHLPIIILSAYDWTDVEAEARQAGVRAFIEKPLFRSRLVYALNSLLSQSGQKAVPVPEQMQQDSFAGKRVLLVEDNQLNREIAQELLGFIGVSVEQAEDGRQALDMVRQSPPHYYDLVFMDIQMPVMDGYEAARAIRALDRPDAGSLPIIAMTANAFASDIRQAKDAGMNGHIAKPVEVDKLMDVLKTWLR